VGTKKLYPALPWVMAFQARWSCLFGVDLKVKKNESSRRGTREKSVNIAKNGGLFAAGNRTVGPFGTDGTQIDAGWESGQKMDHRGRHF